LARFGITPEKYEQLPDDEAKLDTLRSEAKQTLGKKLSYLIRDKKLPNSKFRIDIYNEKNPDALLQTMIKRYETIDQAEGNEFVAKALEQKGKSDALMDDLYAKLHDGS
jgi:hypothetical protein